MSPYFDENYTCYSCRIQSLPGRRIRFASEVECWACWLLRYRYHKEAKLLAAKLVARADPGPARDMLMRYLET